MAILLPLVAGYAIGKAAVYAYKNLLTPEQRRKIENKVKTHHFEYGVVTTTAGIVAKSPTTVGTGLSLIADDWKDKDEAIQNMKNKVNSAINKIQNTPQNSNQTPGSIHINRRFSKRHRRMMYDFR